MLRSTHFWQVVFTFFILYIFTPVNDVVYVCIFYVDKVDKIDFCVCLYDAIAATQKARVRERVSNLRKKPLANDGRRRIIGSGRQLAWWVIVYRWRVHTQSPCAVVCARRANDDNAQAWWRWVDCGWWWWCWCSSMMQNARHINAKTLRLYNIYLVEMETHFWFGAWFSVGFRMTNRR